MASDELRSALAGRAREELRGRGMLLVVVIGVVLLLMATLVLLLNSYEVVDKGRLLPYTTGEIYQIELFDRFTIYAEPEAKRRWTSSTATSSSPCRASRCSR